MFKFLPRNDNKTIQLNPDLHEVTAIPNDSKSYLKLNYCYLFGLMFWNKTILMIISAEK